MKHILVVVFAAYLLSGWLLSTADGVADRELLAVVADLTDAGLKRDVGRLEKLYSPGYFHTNPDGTVMRRDEVFASYRKPVSIPVESQTIDEQIVRLVGTAAALVNGRVVTHGHKDGQEWSRRYRVTWVLSKSGDTWQVVNSHASLILE